MHRWKLALLMLGLLALVLPIAACDDDDDEVSGPGGSQPLVSEITASQEIVAQGGTVNISVNAAGENLVYLWTADAGSFQDASASSTVWTAPDQPGVYLLTVTVRGSGNLTASASIAIGVEIGLQLTASADTLVIAHKSTIAAVSVGSGLVYSWTASAGTLTQVTPDTVVWKAPDTVPFGGATVQVVVVNAAGDTRSASIGITVLPYTPTDEPSYKGVAYCSGCHLDIYDTWENTSHAQAVQTLQAIGQGNNNDCLICHTVGSEGLDANPALNNGGFDDIPIMALWGVQCENCHGPGSEHPSNGMPFLPVTIDASLCGICHNGPHHPTYSEWQESAHGHSTELTDPLGLTFCQKCHNGTYAYHYLNDPTAFANPASVDSVTALACAICHNMHGTDNHVELRAAASTDAHLPDGTVVSLGGEGRLCMACHNGRRGPADIQDQLTEGDEHFGPHHSDQADMLVGTGAYEDVAPGFPFASTSHVTIENACVTCHMQAEEDDPVYTGHGFEPRLDACTQCHGPVTSFSEVGATEDYDGNGVIQGVQLEVEGLLTILYDAILDASDSPAHRAALVANFGTAIGDITISTLAQRKAAYNYFFVEYDGSRGVHNALYAIQLLQQSTLSLAPKQLARATLLLK